MVRGVENNNHVDLSRDVHLSLSDTVGTNLREIHCPQVLAVRKI